ncbi:MAG: YlbF family regulator [Planctomycetes bacterium]|jgi:cell fate (sporulation/competence/biofilm development) regulator YlbF (YheA/YmcA/DUF963 family)|nr:YlbF family regulator [Planctomycetota bacterium]
MEDIINLAQRLGKAISDSPQAQKLRAAREELARQPQVEQILKDYQDQADRITKLENEQKPVEVADKRKLDELHSKLVSNDLFKKLTAAQVEYVDLMRKVNGSIRNQLGPIAQ